MPIKKSTIKRLACLLAAFGSGLASVASAADINKPVQVYILMGQSNMVGMGNIKGDKDGTLEHAIMMEKKYPYLVDGAGNWVVWTNVRYVRVMDGKGGKKQVFNNEPMTVKTCKKIGPEFGIAQHLRQATDAPVMILKSCTGNRSLGWDLLPPGSKGYDFVEKDKKSGKEVTNTYAGYKESPMKWGKGTKPEPGSWYAGKQYDDDVANAKQVLADLDKYCPGEKGYEIAGFFWWQGDKDRYDAGLASHYEENLVHLIEQLRKDFDAPSAKFVCATLGQTEQGNDSNLNEAKILDAMLAVDGTSGKYPQFKGNVATVYTHPISLGGASNSHYNGDSRTYMNVGLAMGEAMVGLVKKK
jgi:hypothetical protein